MVQTKPPKQHASQVVVYMTAPEIEALEALKKSRGDKNRSQTIREAIAALAAQAVGTP
jgi:hypothetical protein